MEEYVCVEFNAVSPEEQEVIIALLGEAGFEGFEQHDLELKAFINKNDFREDELYRVSQRTGKNFLIEEITQKNWNAEWESAFQPVIISDFAAIRADFHQPITGIQHEIIITPKMSFGTGHHATTSMMISQMSKLDFAGKSVMDFGTGTGILAILAAKMGASEVVAIDHDEWSITNARENFERNVVKNIQLEKADRISGNKKFDIILANINKQVIVDNVSSMVKLLRNGGYMLISGILSADEQDITEACSDFSLQLVEKSQIQGWICLCFMG